MSLAHGHIWNVAHVRPIFCHHHHHFIIITVIIYPRLLGSIILCLSKSVWFTGIVVIVDIIFVVIVIFIFFFFPIRIQSIGVILSSSITSILPIKISIINRKVCCIKQITFLILWCVLVCLLTLKSALTV